MLEQAFARIAAGFSGVLGGPYQGGTIVWPGAPIYDDGGSIVVPSTPVSKAAQVQFDAPGEQMRADPDFLERDMRLIVLRDSLDRELSAAATLVVAAGPYAGTWSIETCRGDSANIGWECRARRTA